MSTERDLLGNHCPQVLGSDGLPLLKTPTDWQGIDIKETLVPAKAECGPQYSGLPVLTFGLCGAIRRWYKSGSKTIELNYGSPNFEIYGATYERDYGRWEGEAGSCLRINLTSSFLQRYLPEQAHHFDLETRYGLVDKQLRDTVILLAHEIKAGFGNGKMYTEGLSLSILGWLNKHYRTEKMMTKEHGKLSVRHQVRLIEYIDTALDSDLTIEKMAAELGFSSSRFSVLFRSAFGIPPHQYVMKKRIDRAAHLLRAEPERSIMDIAIATGFSSQSHLTYAFKRYMKQTPARWKKG